jgi:hypothetical protein
MCASDEYSAALRRAGVTCYDDGLLATIAL